MEHRQSPLDNEDKHRQNSAEKSSDASSSERLQKSRSSHFIGSGKNPHEMSNQQIGTDETFPSRVDRQGATHHDTQNFLKHDTDRDPSQDEKKLVERQTREEQAITMPSDGDANHRDNGTGQKSLDLSSRWSQDVYSDLLSTQDRNEKRQLSALEEALEQEWLKSIPLDEYGYRAPKIIELTNVIGVGGVKDLKMRWRFLGEGWIEQTRSGTISPCQILRR